MRAIIKKFEMKQYEAKNGINKGKKFKLLKVTCEVKNDKGIIKTYSGSMSEDYARKYFNYCGVQTKDCIGKECEVSLQKRQYDDKDGNSHTITEIKYFNLLDESGNAIIIPKEDNVAINF